MNRGGALSAIGSISLAYARNRFLRGREYDAQGMKDLSKKIKAIADLAIHTYLM
jgi:hypothetical protein